MTDSRNTDDLSATCRLLDRLAELLPNGGEVCVIGRRSPAITSLDHAVIVHLQWMSGDKRLAIEVAISREQLSASPGDVLTERCIADLRGRIAKGMARMASGQRSGQDPLTGQ